MNPSTPRRRASFLIPIALAAAASSALAQDYTVTQVSDRYAPAAKDAVLLKLAEEGAERVALPFAFAYFGTVYTDLFVHANGGVQFGAAKPGDASRFTNEFPIDGSITGLCAPFWSDLDPTVSGASVSYWTSGDSGARTFVVAWSGIPNADGDGSASFQLQLLEATHDVVFAYAPLVDPLDWTPFGGLVSFALPVIDAPRTKDARTLAADDEYFGGHPGTDYRFAPRVARYTGRLLYDELVVDATGIGNSVREDVPLAGLSAALVWPEGAVAVRAPIGADGSFELVGHALDARTVGDLAILLENDACRLFLDPSNFNPSRIDSVGRIDFSAGQTLGDLVFDDRLDPSGDGRSVLHVALTLDRLRGRVLSTVGEAVPQIDVFVHRKLISVTRYVPEDDEFPARLDVVGGVPPGPPDDPLPLPEVTVSLDGDDEGDDDEADVDAWDADLIARAYGRHVLGALAALPAGPADDAFDAVTSPPNAFAAAFGYYLAALASDRSAFIDGIDSGDALVLDLESPEFESASGDDVAGRIAASLFDLLDGANEDHDLVDGSESRGDVLTVVAGFDSVIDVRAFLAAWSAQGKDALGLSRLLVAHGVLGDDGSELNDFGSEATVLGEDGAALEGRVLVAFNEDWYEIGITQDTPRVLAAISYPPRSDNPDVELELHAPGGRLAATATLPKTGGDVRLADEQPELGTYRLRVRHLGGTELRPYRVQMHRAVAFDGTPLPAWTVGRPYDRQLAISGGIPPYDVAPVDATTPPGLLFLSDGRVTGTPDQVGRYGFTLNATDAGVPLNGAFSQQDVVINPPVALPLGPFVAFPLGRSHAVATEAIGGTEPYVVTADGDLPPGIVSSPDVVRLAGVATAPGSFDFALAAEDVAGSADEAAARGVVCVELLGKKTPVDLAAGDASCGFWVDAVAGSRLNVTFKTARKRVRRHLSEPVVLAPDQSVLTDAKLRGASGRATVKGLTVPQSGRYFVITGAATGEATELLGTAKVRPFRRTKGRVKDFAPEQTLGLEFGALSGATLALTAKAPRKSGLEIHVIALVDPDGNPTPLDGLVTRKGSRITLRAELGLAGTWHVTLSGSGSPGRLDYRLNVRQPKGGRFSADDL